MKTVQIFPTRTAVLALGFLLLSSRSAPGEPSAATDPAAAFMNPDTIALIDPGSKSASAADPVHPNTPPVPDGSPPVHEAVQLTEIQDRLLSSARSLLGAQSLVVNGRRYSYDCSGTVMAIYATAGVDLTAEYVKYGGNGVNRIYRIMEHAGLLYDTARPAAGDIIFWDDTYDRNGDGLVNDPLTHTGMVLSVSVDGIISYVHFNYAKGIIVEYMSLESPDTYRITSEGKTVSVNSPMRMRSARNGTEDKWLAGQLYNAFGKGYLFR